MMSVLWKKIEFYKEESNSEVNVITAGGLLWAGCCKPALADRFFHYGALPSYKISPLPIEVLVPYCYLKWDTKVKKSN